VRSIAAPALAVLSGPVVPLVLLVEMLFSPAVRLCSGAVAVQYGADLYYGTGSLGAVEAVSDEAQGTQQLRFTLSGVPSDTIALALGETVRGVVCAVRLGVLDPTTQALLDAPVVFTGTLDQMPITHGATTSTVGVVAIHRGETFRRPKPLRYTDGDQKMLYAADTSLRYVQSQAQVQDVWPAAAFFER